MAAKAAELVRQDPDVKTALPLEFAEGNPKPCLNASAGPSTSATSSVTPTVRHREGSTRTQHDAVENRSG
jgi:hypothetical protein